MNGLRPGIPRWMEILVAALGLLALSPLLLLCAVAVLLSGPGPVIFRQQRMGRFGKSFTFYKFRTMGISNEGAHVTAAGDRRVTTVGKLLRKTKLDELPEFWNVIRGDLSLVGPRPEVPCYVDINDASWKRVLSVRPGLTDPVTLRLRNEEELLAGAGGDPEVFYRRSLLPFKLNGYIHYLERRTLSSDIGILFRTFFAVFFPDKMTPPSLREVLSGGHVSRPDPDAESFAIK